MDDKYVHFMDVKAGEYFIPCYQCYGLGFICFDNIHGGYKMCRYCGGVGYYLDKNDDSIDGDTGFWKIKRK